MSRRRAQGPPALVVSCEHARNDVPAALAPRFAGAARVLASHRGWDPGALELAADLARAAGVPLAAGRWSRLVVDLNRSEDHPRVFSEFTRDLPEAQRRELLARWHRPHRARVSARIEQGLRRRGRVLHVGCHSFTPVLADRRRDMDVGLLHDPHSLFERELCERLGAALRRRAPYLRVAFNRPYRGWTDGLTTTLRARFGPPVYAGLEFELNQALLAGAPSRWRALRRLLVAELGELLSA